MFEGIFISVHVLHLLSFHLTPLALFLLFPPIIQTSTFSSDSEFGGLPALESQPLRKPNQTTSLANIMDLLWEVKGSLAPCYLLCPPARVLLCSLASLQPLCSRERSLGLHSI